MTNVLFGLPQILSSFLMIIICCFTARYIALDCVDIVLTKKPGLRCGDGHRI